MNNGQLLSSLHAELNELYRGKSTDLVRIKKLWEQIDKLEGEENGGEY